MGALGAYISSEDEAILQKMAVKYDQAQTPQQKAQIKHDIERVTKGSLVKEDMVEEGLDTSWMNEKQKKFYDINPSFKDTSKEVVSFGDRKLATRVSPAGGIPKVGKKSISPFGPQDMAEGSLNEWVDPGAPCSRCGLSHGQHRVQFNKKNPNVSFMNQDDEWNDLEMKNAEDHTYTPSKGYRPLSQREAELVGFNNLNVNIPNDIYDRINSVRQRLARVGKDAGKLTRVKEEDMAKNSLEEVSLDLAKRARDKAEYAVDMDYDDMRDRPEGYSEKQRSKFQRYIDKKEPRAKGDRDWDPPKQGVEEDLDANQKRVGQLGPYEKVGPKGAVGKLVGGESIREGQEDLDTIRRLLGK